MEPATRTRASGNPAWRQSEYELIACAMLPLMLKGKHRYEAIQIAQRLLPKNRRRPTGKPLQRNLVSENYRAALERVQKMTPEERAAIVNKMTDEQRAELAPPAPIVAAPKPAPTPRPAPLTTLKRSTPPGREIKLSTDGKMRPTSLVRWRPREIALLARRVGHYQRDLQDKRPLYRLIMAAQDIELPPERRRGGNSISACLANVRQQLIEGFKSHHELLTDSPFDPNRTEYLAPQIDAAAAPREPSPGVNIDGPRKQPAVQAPEPAAAPIPAPTPRSLVSEPVRAFGDAFAQAMNGFIEATTHNLMSELELRLTVMSERLMAKTIETLGHGVVQMVHSALERELGGPVQAPAGVDGFELPEGAALPDRLKIDVVGVKDALAAEVRQQLNGHAIGIRFIEQDKIDAWQPLPRRTVILNTKFSSHSAERKCSKAGVKPIRIQGGSGAILNAIRELYAAEGMTFTHAH